MTPNPLLAQLGFPPDARLVIFHADDVGMCHGSNQAYQDLTRAGLLQAGSVMVPCPWAPEILEYGRTHPEVDLGVHLTLTCEWPHYRWGPISTRDQASGLMDTDGCFWRETGLTGAKMNVDAAIREMRAQIERALAAGLDVTHLDTHMGAAAMPALLMAYVELGFEYQVPVMMPRRFDSYMQRMNPQVNPEEVAAFAAQIEARGMPLIDTLRITPCYSPIPCTGDYAGCYEQVLAELAPGVTYFSLHPNAPGDIETIVPELAAWRTFEHAYFQSDRLRNFLAAQGIVPIGYRMIRDVMRAAR
jgi:chitin disaccharide deacetylase